jgi:hypothetical protein
VGGMVFFQKNVLIPNVAEKNILILVEKKKSDSEFLSYYLMLISGKKIRALRPKKNSNSCVDRKKILNETKKTYPPLPPPLQVKWSFPNLITI